jgi:hypothetical protein
MFHPYNQELGPLYPEAEVTVYVHSMLENRHPSWICFYQLHTDDSEYQIEYHEPLIIGQGVTSVTTRLSLAMDRNVSGTFLHTLPEYEAGISMHDELQPGNRDLLRFAYQKCTEGQHRIDPGTPVARLKFDIKGTVVFCVLAPMLECVAESTTRGKAMLDSTNEKKRRRSEGSED